MNIQDITPSQVRRAYKGKPGCMCGCKGKYYVNKLQGPDDYSTVDPKNVIKVLRAMQLNEELVDMDVTGDETIFFATISGKNHTIYVDDDTSV